MLGMSIPFREPARWDLTRAHVIWATGTPPSWMTWAQSPLPRSKLYKGCPVRARVPTCRRYPHHPQPSPPTPDPPRLLLAQDSPSTLPRPYLQRTACRCVVPAAAVGQHHCHGRVLLGDQPGPVTPRQWWGHAFIADPSTPVPPENGASVNHPSRRSG
jgi:hypothetical protein